jgi:GNAT superfamily N-acetyltransferase
MNASVTLAENREQVARCFPVMQELRPLLTGEAEFVERVLRQQTQGYQLAYVEADGIVRAVAGFWLTENLAYGRFIFVDDLVTREVDRSLGLGKLLFDWLVSHARVAGCERLQLDSGVQRFAAHRFYLNQRMDITAHHFGLKL